MNTSDKDKIDISISFGVPRAESISIEAGIYHRGYKFD